MIWSDLLPFSLYPFIVLLLLPASFCSFFSSSLSPDRFLPSQVIDSSESYWQLWGSSYLNCRGGCGKLSHPTTHTLPLSDLSICRHKQGLLKPKYLSPVFVPVGPRCPVRHLPVPRRQQLLRTHHPGLCDDVATRGCGSRGLLRSAQKVSNLAFHSADCSCLVQRAAAGLGGCRPRLGLIQTKLEVGVRGEEKLL